jgi:UDP-N-acetylmuramoyl-tripeptide--D-alanyl-D-alanine ligase
MNLSIDDIVTHAGGVLSGGASSIIVKQISTDTRVLKDGDFYVALRGHNFDGHAFVSDARKMGAMGALVSHDFKDEGDDSFAIIRVADTLKALGDIAHAWRKKFDIPVIGITGSSGKTTTKDMLTCILSVKGEVCKTRGNLNNLIGLPLTLFRLDENHQFAVVEMGMNAFGEIARLTEIASPTIGLITNVGQAHLEGVGNIEGVRKAKGELFEGLNDRSIAVVNADDVAIKSLPTKAERIFFGFSDDAEIRGREMISSEEHTQLKVSVGDKMVLFDLPFKGEHLALDFLGAMAVAHELGFKSDEIQKGISQFQPGRMRGEILKYNLGFWLIHDAYNANPSSVEASFKLLSQGYQGRRKIAVLGDMLELGEHTEKMHFETGAKAASLEINILIAVGEYASFVANGYKKSGGNKQVLEFKTPDDAGAYLKKIVAPGDVLLVKGSRGVRMEKVVEFLDRSFERVV